MGSGGVAEIYSLWNIYFKPCIYFCFWINSVYTEFLKIQSVLFLVVIIKSRVGFINYLCSDLDSRAYTAASFHSLKRIISELLGFDAAG